MNIACLNYGFDIIEGLGIKAIQKHVHTVTDYLYQQLKHLQHSNGKPVVEIYGKHELNNETVQGGIVSFNIKHDNGEYIGYYDIQQAAAEKNIHVRTGCHCNPGACRKYLKQPLNVYEK